MPRPSRMTNAKCCRPSSPLWTTAGGSAEARTGGSGCSRRSGHGGEYAGAAEGGRCEWSKSTGSEPHAPILFKDYGLILLRMRRSPESVECLARAPTVDCATSDSHLCFGLAWNWARYTDETLQQFQAALRLRPKDHLACAATEKVRKMHHAGL
jgi:hypothetical protein